MHNKQLQLLLLAAQQATCGVQMTQFDSCGIVLHCFVSYLLLFVCLFFFSGSSVHWFTLGKSKDMMSINCCCSQVTINWAAGAVWLKAAFNCRQRSWCWSWSGGCIQNEGYSKLQCQQKVLFDKVRSQFTWLLRSSSASAKFPISEM